MLPTRVDEDVDVEEGDLALDRERHRETPDEEVEDVAELRAQCPELVGDDPPDLVLVAEEPGVGLGARIAGVESVDPGDLSAGAPEAVEEAASEAGKTRNTHSPAAS